MVRGNASSLRSKNEENKILFHVRGLRMIRWKKFKLTQQSEKQQQLLKDFFGRGAGESLKNTNHILTEDRQELSQPQPGCSNFNQNP